MQRLIFIKKHVGEFGKHPAERTVEELIQYGIVNIDKPKVRPATRLQITLKNSQDF